MNNDTDAMQLKPCPKCEGYGYDIFPEVDCDACLGKATVSSSKASEQGILRVVDSCGGADAIDESADWNRGYNDALAAVDRELKRYFARTTSLAAQDGLVEALSRQADNMAFILNRVDLPPQWHDKFTKELEQDRAALASIVVKSS